MTVQPHKGALRHDPEYIPGPGMSFHRCRRCGDLDLGGWRFETCTPKPEEPLVPRAALDALDHPGYDDGS